MHLELVRDRARDFPAIDNASSFSSARIWHCRYRTLQPLANFVGLRTLSVATYPDPSFDILARLTSLESLEVVHLPEVRSLSPLTLLKNLRSLSLQTLPSWDASGKKTVVESLAPVANLPFLEELELFGVVPASGTVDDLLDSSSPRLKRVRVSKYPKREQERLFARFAA